MAMTVNTTVGAEVEGIQISDELQEKLFPGQNEWQIARGTEALLIDYYALIVRIIDGSTAEQARLYVTQNITRIQ